MRTEMYEENTVKEVAPEFAGFPKMARLRRECVLTEKINGTNSQIMIDVNGGFHTGSRTRWITPKNDNHGFSRWAHEHKEELMQLGPGRHFGEFWGSGIQNGYGLKEKRWSLFNVLRWYLPGEPQGIWSESWDPVQKALVPRYQERLPECCHLVPILYRGIFTTDACENALEDLRVNGSRAVPGYFPAEGIVAFHIAGNVGFKVTLGNDGAKGTE